MASFHELLRSSVKVTLAGKKPGKTPLVLVFPTGFKPDSISDAVMKFGNVQRGNIAGHLNATGSVGNLVKPRQIRTIDYDPRDLDRSRVFVSGEALYTLPLYACGYRNVTGRLKEKPIEFRDSGASQPL